MLNQDAGIGAAFIAISAASPSQDNADLWLVAGSYSVSGYTLLLLAAGFLRLCGVVASCLTLF